ncbi:initiation control protein YabA [Lactobacillus sp. YT155]|uniref:initiation control protein YabA n=1 Tax=Lactobacillus sp. YT155 TaxID=3060955 RepID=UPI00265E554D|nr:initiation control protein YabA [Lactobacillus sp. YT155]MDO1604435.1 initiation control protein YabA [Lactobacillus sp. YT155]
MTQKDYFLDFEQLVKQSSELSERMKEMQKEISKILVENAELKIENENLREKFNNKDESLSDFSKAHQNLEKLYEKGYHVCQPMYGARRKDDEECAFCLEIIYRTKDNSKVK